MSDTGGLSKKEWAQLMFAGARQAPQQSSALPAHAYRDPSETVMFEAERVARDKARATRKQADSHARNSASKKQS